MPSSSPEITSSYRDPRPSAIGSAPATDAPSSSRISYFRYIIPAELFMTETEIVFSVQESPEGGYEAKALGYSIYTRAETLPDLKEALKDAVRCHFGDADQPKLIRLHLVKDEVIQV
jgi:hypothetical protein